MKHLVFFSCLLLTFGTFSQSTHSDSLRGGYGSSRNWWDLKHYDLSVTFDIDKQEIRGKNIITFTTPGKGPDELVVRTFLQLDLQDPMILDSIFINGQYIDQSKIRKDGNAYFIPYDSHDGAEGSENKLIACFHGKPRVAKRAPWDGGVIWTKDPNGKPWVTVACQGQGASVWFPCKDSQFDEPDNGVSMNYTCPENLVCVSNGIFGGKKINGGGQATYSWRVTNPINNYCMIPYIGDYVNMHEHFNGEKGKLEIDYWVIRGNEEKAKKQFQDAPKTLKALEYWFGPYPFYEDGYKLVEAPHLGMEHQSAVAYGNGYKNGYLGSDLSNTGVGLKWDFIIVHESGHEWYGNNITTKDIADMWVHEGFTCYSETLFTEYWFGKEDADKYIQGLRKNILNDKPVIGPYGVNTEGSGDMYYKGANMLHTIRQVINDDEKFRKILRGLNKRFYHQTVTGEEVEQYINKESGIDFSKVFDQYLRTTKIPVLKYESKNGKIFYRWNNCVEGFNMPLKVYDKKGKLIFIHPTEKFRQVPKSIKQIKVDENFYVDVKEVK